MERISNAPIEHFFGNLKTHILNNEKNLKCSRLIRKLRQNVLSLYTEQKLNIAKSRLTKQQAPRDVCSAQGAKETWAKKRKPKNSYFLGRYLKKQKILPREELEMNPEEEITRDSEKCIYCGFGRLDVTVDWVQCDKCDKWVHQACENGKDFENTFYCKLCCNIISPPETVSTDNNLAFACEHFLAVLSLDDNARKKLELKTRLQSKSETWFEERKKRLTASFFGKICKASSEKSLSSVVDQILKGHDNLKYLSAIKHGCKYEKIAISVYSKQTKNQVYTSGLVVHKDYSFLAASPDGMVNNDGIIEIKCPYSARNICPENAKLIYLDENRCLRRNHDYYYQVQALLEITNRLYCDFVIYTFKGIHIERINRDRRFFMNIIPKLKEFYFFHLLPRLVCPNKKHTSLERKWMMTKPLEILTNGLVNDSQYYTSLSCKKGYTVCKFENIEYCPVKEILISDFLSLNPPGWLTNFVIESAINLFIEEEEHLFQLIPSEISSKIFNEEQIPLHFIDVVQLKKPKIFMPILINQNHWILCYIDLINKTLTLLDPLGSDTSKSDIFLCKFKSFLSKYSAKRSESIVNPNDIKVSMKGHVKQMDSYNCGAFVIYYSQQIIKNKPLTDECDINSYRRNIQDMFLSKSVDMHSMCLLCGSNLNNMNTDAFSCKYCKRSYHQTCLFLRGMNTIRDNFCELCRTY